MKKHVIFLTLAVLLVGAVLVSGVEERTDSAAAIYTSEQGAGAVALTFDDGPGNLTEELLDLLLETDSKCTFFVAGYKAENHMDILERIVREGHQLGNHSYSHKTLTALSDEELYSEINRTTALLEAAGAEPPFCLRPPYGSYDKRILAMEDSPIILWSLDPDDWDLDRSTQQIVSSVMCKVKDGDIILMHDILSHSVKAAELVVEELQKAGFRLVTVTELFALNGTTLEGGMVYRSAEG